MAGIQFLLSDMDASSQSAFDKLGPCSNHAAMHNSWCLLHSFLESELYQQHVLWNMKTAVAQTSSWYSSLHISERPNLKTEKAMTSPTAFALQSNPRISSYTPAYFCNHRRWHIFHTRTISGWVSLIVDGVDFHKNRALLISLT